MTYLKHRLIQQPCPKHSDPLCADHSIVPSQQIQGLHLLTVQVQGYRLILHTVGYPVPPESTKRNTKIINIQSEYLVSEEKSEPRKRKGCLTPLSSQEKQKGL